MDWNLTGQVVPFLSVYNISKLNNTKMQRLTPVVGCMKRYTLKHAQGMLLLRPYILLPHVEYIVLHAPVERTIVFNRSTNIQCTR